MAWVLSGVCKVAEISASVDLGPGNVSYEVLKILYISFYEYLIFSPPSKSIFKALKKSEFTKMIERLQKDNMIVAYLASEVGSHRFHIDSLTKILYRKIYH